MVKNNTEVSASSNQKVEILKKYNVINATRVVRRVTKHTKQIISNRLIKANVWRLNKFPQRVDLLILDAIFPHPLSPFRLQEFCSYLERFKECRVLTNGFQFEAIRETRGLDDIINDFGHKYPQHKSKVKKVSLDIDGYRPKLAYLVFLDLTFDFLPSLEKKKIPFVFTLYPGGGFFINDVKSDAKLKSIFTSKYFRRVIVTQRLTYEYILHKQLCPNDKIEYIFGVVTPTNILNNSMNCSKISFGIDKSTLDVCFVAHKYMERGVDGVMMFLSTWLKS